MKYKLFSDEKFSYDGLHLKSVQPEDIELIRNWRNSQTNVLRQNNVINKDEQVDYFNRFVFPEYVSDQPSQILFTLWENEIAIGYGGLVHISWHDLRAEISFLLNKDIVEDKVRYQSIFSKYLRALKSISFDVLGFNKIYTEAYDIRPYHIDVIEYEGFILEGILKEHVLVEGVKVDSLMHAYLKDMYENEKKSILTSVSNNNGNILISSASSKVQLYKSVVEAANKISKDIFVYAGDVDENCIASYLIDKFVVMPATVDFNVSKILSLLNSLNIKLVIPTRDSELEFWSKNKHHFNDNGISVLVSSPSSVKVCLDKLTFYKKVVSLDYPVISTSDNIDDIQSSDRYVVKERFGAGSDLIGINLNKDDAINHAKKLTAPIFQPYIKGLEFSADCWLDSNCKIKGVILRTRDLVMNGESQITTTFSDKNLERSIKKLTEGLLLSGPVVVQGIIDKPGGLNLLECNCRFGGASTLSIRAGLDLFYWSIMESFGFPVSDIEFKKSVKEVRQVRFKEDAYHDIDF